MQLTVNIAPPVTSPAEQCMLAQPLSNLPQAREGIHGFYTAEITMTELQAQMAELQTQLRYFQHKISLLVDENTQWRVLYAGLAQFHLGAYLGGQAMRGAMLV